MEYVIGALQWKLRRALLSFNPALLTTLGQLNVAMLLPFILGDHLNGNLCLTFDHFKRFLCQYACLNSLIWLVIGRSKKINMQLCSCNTISSFCKHRLSSVCHYSGCIIAGKLDLIEKNWLQFWSQHPSTPKTFETSLAPRKKKFCQPVINNRTLHLLLLPIGEQLVSVALRPECVLCCSEVLLECLRRFERNW